MTGYVYAIENAAGFVKIGWSADPRRRLSKINSDTSSPCVLLGYVEATLEQEAALHMLLTPEVEHGEWFRRGPLVNAFLLALPQVPPAADTLRERGTRFAGLPANHALTKFRFANDLSKADLARLVGTTRQTIHRLERGEQTPSLSLLHRIREATDGAVSSDDFRPTTEGATA